MRFSALGPPFPGFDMNSNGNVPTSYLNIYLDDIFFDWNIISESHQIGTNSRLEQIIISYEDDGIIRALDLKFISDIKNGFKYYWIQFLPSKKVYLITSSFTEQCVYFDEFIKVNEFLNIWSQLNLQKMKPNGEFEWYEFSFFGHQVNYACEETKKYFIVDEKFIPFGNDRLPVTGYFISSFGMVKDQGYGPGKRFAGKGYTDYFLSNI